MEFAGFKVCHASKEVPLRVVGLDLIYKDVFLCVVVSHHFIR